MIPIDYKKNGSSSENGEATKEIEEDLFDQTSGGDRNLFKYS